LPRWLHWEQHLQNSETPPRFRTHEKSIRPTSWPASLNQQDRAFVSSLPDANTSLFLDEIQERLIESRDVEVSIVTLSRTFRRLALTYKHASKAI
jgi:hypothetical protein